MDNKKTREKAVALRYDKEQEQAPRVIAKGEGNIAEKIIALATENDIPITEDRDLVELLSLVELDQEIPPELYNVVAEVLSWIYKANDQFKIDN